MLKKELQKTQGRVSDHNARTGRCRLVAHSMGLGRAVKLELAVAYN